MEKIPLDSASKGGLSERGYEPDLNVLDISSDEEIRQSKSLKKYW